MFIKWKLNFLIQFTSKSCYGDIHLHCLYYASLAGRCSGISFSQSAWTQWRGGGIFALARPAISRGGKPYSQTSRYNERVLYMALVVRRHSFIWVFLMISLEDVRQTTWMMCSRFKDIKKFSFSY